jgi:hypothetical protein
MKNAPVEEMRILEIKRLTDKSEEKLKRKMILFWHQVKLVAATQLERLLIRKKTCLNIHKQIRRSLIKTKN